MQSLNEIDLFHKWQISTEEFTCVQPSFHIGLVVAGGDSGKLYIWNVKSDHDPKILDVKHGLSGLQFLPQQSNLDTAYTKLLFTADHSGKIRLWDLEEFLCLAQVSGHRDAIRSLDSSYTR